MASTWTGLWPFMLRMTASARSGLGSRTAAIKSGFSFARTWTAVLSGRMFDEEQSKPSATMSMRTFSPNAGVIGNNKKIHERLILIVVITERPWAT